MSQLAAAFRLRSVVVEQGPVAKGTSKQALTDQVDVGSQKHKQLVRAFVDALFTDDYLRSRGLDDDARDEHNRLVAAAVDHGLARWDKVAAHRNLIGDVPSVVTDFTHTVFEVSHDVLVRVAAYLTLYGLIHPALVDATTWPSKPGVKAWWGETLGRAHEPIDASPLSKKKRGRLAFHTLKKIRSGRSLPQDTVIADLADTLARHGIRTRDGSRDETAAEIEFELRLACGLADLSRWMRSSSWSTLDQAASTFFQGAVPCLDPPQVIDLLTRGVGSEAWPQLQQGVRILAFAGLMEMRNTVMTHTEEMLRLAEKDIRQCYALTADDFERQSTDLASRLPPGSDDMGAIMAEFTASSAKFFRALANGEPRLVVRDGFDDDMRAIGMCYQALARWNQHTKDQQEKLFRQAVEACPHLAYPKRMLAQHLVSQGRFEEELGLLQEAVNLNPVNIEGRELLIDALLRRQMYEEMTKLAYEPSSVVLDTARALGLVRTERVEDAEEIVERLLPDHSNDPLVLEVDAACKEERGDKRGAAAARRKAKLLGHGVTERAMRPTPT